MLITTENFHEAVEMLRRDCLRCCTTDIAESTCMPKSTVHDFAHGRTRCPRLVNFVRIAGYFGYQITMQTMLELARKNAA